MLNYLWLGLVLLAVLIGGITGRMKELTEGAFGACEVAVMKIALPLAGMMVLWLGIMRLAEKSGLVQIVANALMPIMRRLFPDVPPQHPAMGSMLMNMAANMLGLGNAATSLGLRAMRDLETLNRQPGTATNAMCTFLAVNTSSIQILPTTAIGILVAAKAQNPTAIVGPALLATAFSTVVAITAVKWLEKWKMFQIPTQPPAEAVVASAAMAEPEIELAAPPPVKLWGRAVLILFGLFFIALLGWPAVHADSFQGMVNAARGGLFPKDPAFAFAPEFLQRPMLLRGIETLSVLGVPFFLAFFPLYAALRGVKVYEEFVEGGKEGFQVAVRIIPFLVAILVAIAMFRSVGGIEGLRQVLSPVLTPLGFPPDLLPLVLVRPLSGSGTVGLFTELASRPDLGPDHLVTRMAGTIFGSSETTFYVIAVYFGSVAIRRTRHAVPAGLIGDAAGVIASILICRWIFI